MAIDFNAEFKVRNVIKEYDNTKKDQQQNIEHILMESE
jgi:hypothetical protein